VYKTTVAEKFLDPSLFCSSVLILLIDNFGTEVMDWEPESIYTELDDVFKVNPDMLLADKINAACTLVGTDLYHKSLEAFTTLNSVLNFKMANPGEFNHNSLEDIMWGVTEARLLEGGEDFERLGFSHDIAGFTASLLSVEGITRPPDILTFAEYRPSELDQRDLILATDQVAAEMYWQRQADENAKLEERAKNNLAALLKQVNELPLANGKAELPDAFKGLVDAA